MFTVTLPRRPAMGYAPKNRITGQKAAAVVKFLSSWGERTGLSPQVPDNK
jgi:hypothetical protein